MIEQIALGRLFSMFRKYFYQGMKTRFGRQYVNHSSDEFVGGYYRTFFSKMYKDLVQYKVGLKAFEAGNWSDFEKQQARRMATELSLITATALAVGAIQAMGEEDEEHSKGYYYGLYLLFRLRSELSAFIYPPDVARVLQQPTFAFSSLTRLLKAMDYMLPWNWDEEMERDSGLWDKGDSKALVYTMKFLGVNSDLANPELAFKNLQNVIK